MKSRRSLAPLLVVALTLAGCASLHVPFFGPKPAPAEPPPLTSDWQATMHRSGCYGRCPTYKVTVNGDGSVLFVGERFVAATGEQTGTVQPEALARLQRKLLDAQAGLLDSYTPNDKSCGVWATDFPTVTLDLSIDGHARQIRHYLGCERAPQALRDLETSIDAAADVMRWTKGPSS